MDEKMNARPSLAMTRVAWQMWEGTLSPADALRRGTAFSALYMPLPGKGGARMNHEKDLRAVSEWSFLADDLKLYLDTHPDDATRWRR